LTNNVPEPTPSAFRKLRLLSFIIYIWFISLVL
jgi:hypothetical protein